MSRQSGWDIPAEGALPPGTERPNTTIRFGSPPLQPGVAVTPAPEEAAAAYGLGARLGQAGDVYEARSPRFQDRVAMKLYRRATGVGISVAEVFAADAARASGLRHPHIVQVIEAGTLRDGTPFVTMEYLVGRTLEDALKGRGAFLATELLPLIRGAASALSAAHDAGLVHRAVRPDNIFVVELAGYESGFVKMLDFGACHLTAAEIRAERQPSAREARYFAPEQADGGRNDDVDARADQFALAAIAYRMLSGADPRGQMSPGASGGAATLMPLARRAPAVDAVVSKALSRLPEDRFESVALFLRAFEEALAGAALVATPAPARAETLGPARPPRAAVSEQVAPVAPEHPQQPAPAPVASQPRAPIPRRYPAIERPSLTQQFFQDGDHHEATRYEDARLDDSDFSDSSQDFDSFDRIPKRRAPLVVAVLVVVVASAGLAWWGVMRAPPSWRESALWRTLHLPPAGAPVPMPPPAAPAPAAPEATAAAPLPASPPQPGMAPVPQGEPPTAVPPPAPPAEEPGQAAAAPVPPAAAAVPAEPSPVPPPAADSQSPPATPPQASTAKRPRNQKPRPPVIRGTPALRGYTWSPEKRRMVPAEGKTEPWPRFESPPAPAPSDSRPGPPPFTP